MFQAQAMQLGGTGQAQSRRCSFALASQTQMDEESHSSLGHAEVGCGAVN